MDRRKTILFIGILYLVSSVAAGAICYTTSTGAGVNIADEKQDADTASGQSEPETTPEALQNETEKESEAVTSVEETETSAEPESSQENTEATQENTETESAGNVENTDNTEAAGNTESTVTTAAESEAETDTQVTSQEAWTNAKHYNARVVNTGTSGLNVRARADIGADVVGLLREDEVVEVIDIYGDWYHIRNGGLEGYSYYKYLELIEQP